MSELHTSLRRAAIVAGAAYLAQGPYLVYLTRVAYPDVIRQRYPSLTVEDLLSLDLMRIAVIVVIAAFVGAFFSERNGLPGLGTRETLLASRRVVALAAITGLTFFIFGGEVARALPGQFPCAMQWALVSVVKAAVFDEVVARYGMMTLMQGVIRRPAIANLLQAIFFTAVGSRALSFDGGAAGPGLDPVTIASVGTSLFVALVCGYSYMRFGLVAAMLVHLALGVRLLAHAASC